MTGHKTESIYRRYAIVDEAMLRESAETLAAYHASAGTARRSVSARDGGSVTLMASRARGAVRRSSASAMLATRPTIARRARPASACSPTALFPAAARRLAAHAGGTGGNQKAMRSIRNLLKLSYFRHC